MIRLLLGIASIAGATLLFIKGETTTKWLGKSNKWFKTLIGIPPALFISLLWSHSWVLALLTVAFYFIALQFGYGEKNPLTRIFGKMGAIIICGALMGLASFPIIGWFSILQAIISGYNFYWLEKHTDTIFEPRVALQRGLLGVICLIW